MGKTGIGDRFGQLVVIRLRVRQGPARHWYHLCQCDCGNEIEKSDANLRSGPTTSCGKCNEIIPGMKFGRWTVVSHIEQPGRSVYSCKCDCGNMKTVKGVLLKNGGSKSCGCLQNEIRCKFNFKHGFEGTRIYRIWRNMKTRCQNMKATQYQYYGGRGITVCEEWNEFVPFMEWAVSHGYSDSLTIDRIDNDGNYCPENCRWIPSSENIAKSHVDKKRRIASSERSDGKC